MSEPAAGRTAVIAGMGPLPAIVAEALRAGAAEPVLAAPEGVALEAEGAVERFRLERLVPLFDRLHDLGVTRVVLAGGMRRPRLDPELFDPRTAQLVPRLLAALRGGDDAALRTVIGVFEEAGFAVVGAHEVVPGLLPPPGALGALSPRDGDLADIARAAEIARALGAVDVGQGAVVAGGLCLAVEVLAGTDAMLAHVAAMKDHAGRGGVLYKAPKPGQDLRADMPAVGPHTVAGAARAGLAGIAFPAGGVLVFDRAATAAAADAAGLFLWSCPP
jgi:DUF1009 family protein